MLLRLGRRSFVALLGAFLTAAAAVERRRAVPTEQDRFTIVNGWILKTTDLGPPEQ